MALQPVRDTKKNGLARRPFSGKREVLFFHEGFFALVLHRWQEHDDDHQHRSGQRLRFTTVFLFCFALLASLLTIPVAEAAKNKPQRKSTIGGYSSIVIDAASGQTLFEDRADVVTDDDRAATEALRQWQYSPLVLNGIKTPFVLTVTFNFSVAHK